MANHASHAALPYPVKGARLTLAIPYLDADGDPTDPVAPATEISRDGAVYDDCTEEVTVIAGVNGSAYLTLTGDELNCSLVFLAAKVGSGPKNTLATLYPRVLPVLRSATAAAGSATTLTLDADASQQDDYYNGSILKTTGGTGGGGGSGSRDNQARIITDYAGSTRVATVAPAWEVTPDGSTTFVILQTELAGHTLASPVHPTVLPSQVDVANLALLKLGETQITTFDDDSPHARVLKLVYPRVVDSVLRARKWRFAVRQATPALLAGTPTWRYTYRFQLPTDPFCLRVLRVSPEEDGAPRRGEALWEVQGHELLANDQIVNVEYIARITDPQQWDVLFLECLTERLAAEVCLAVTGVPSVRQALFQTYLAKLQEAATTDGMEGAAEVDLESSLTDVR